MEVKILIKIIREILKSRRELLLSRLVLIEIREELQAIRKNLELKTRVSIDSTSVSEATCDRVQEVLSSLQNPDHQDSQ